MAKYKKKRARQLQHDKFRDTTMGFVDRAAHRLHGKGKVILYGIVAVVLVGLLAWGVMAWMGSRNDDASQAMGKALKIMQSPVVETPVPGSTEPSFKTEKERAQKAVEEFQKVAASYGGATAEYARYFAATNQLVLDRAKATGELEALTKSGYKEVASLSRFALAQAKEADAKYDEAASIYAELAKANDSIITPDTANLQLAMTYQKLGKKSEAADILFKIVETARQAKDKDGKPAALSAAARKATDELEKLDSQRFAQLPPLPLPGNLAR